MKITDAEAILLCLPEVSVVCDGTQDTSVVRLQFDQEIEATSEADSIHAAARNLIPRAVPLPEVASRAEILADPGRRCVVFRSHDKGARVVRGPVVGPLL